MRRTLFTEEQDLFRSSVRSFLQREAVPHTQRWEADGIVDRSVWVEAGKQGLLAFEVPEEFGGAGIRDFRYNAIVGEELAGTGTVGLGLTLQNDILSPYLVELCTQEQKARWLPGFVTGELIAAIAMTEPGAGSDLQGIKTTARREGDHYVVNGSKTFITNGILADLVVVVARTDPEAGHKGISLVVVERGMPGFSRGRNLAKVGQKAQDTAELSFVDVRVPVENLLGEEGKGFYALMRNLPQERLSIAVNAVAASERALRLTVDYAKERRAFGQSIGSFQANRFYLAEMQTKLEVARAYVDRCIEALNAGELTGAEAAGAKWWTSELQQEVVDRCVQLHGGYGYMDEYEISRMWRDARIQTIYGGTTEIMKEIVGRSMGF